MHAIQKVILEIKKLGGIENPQEAQELQQLFNGATNYLQCTELQNTPSIPMVNCTQNSGNHESNTNNNLRNTDDRQPLPRVSQPTTRVERLTNNGPPASRTRSKTANIRIENAAATRAKGRQRRSMQRLSKRIEKMENEVHEALAVMDAETGKVLNYRQLMQSAKQKETWSKSSGNKFGRLANGVGGASKEPTQ